jgi:hypothetical protein
MSLRILLFVCVMIYSSSTQFHHPDENYAVTSTTITC